ncbi:MAG TPA: methyl-accepting chemotaxis protein [Phenylobacterium sp.]|nr:methyl-accepting chemotaxis protein [Phenylobacterium sp.]
MMGQGLGEMRFNDLKISAKLGIAFSALIIAFVVSSGVVFTSLTRIEEASVSTQRSLSLATQAEEMMTLVLEQQNALRAYALLGDADFAKAYKENAAQFDKALDAFEGKTTVAEQKARIQRLRAAVGVWRKTIAEPAQAAVDNDPVMGRITAGELMGRKSLTDIRAVQQELTDAAAERVALRAKEMKSAMDTAILSLVLGGVAALVIAGLMGWMLSGTIGASVVAMTAAMRRLASGDNTIEVPAVGRKDEVGQMAQAVLSFKDAAIHKLRLEDEAVEQRRLTEAERARVEAEKARKAQEDAIAVSALAEALGHLSNGDLTFRITAAFAPDAEQLKTDFNAAAARLEEAMRGINGAAGGIRAGSEEIAQASDDLSRRTEQQAASLEETAAALEQITATVNKTASGARQASSVVQGARGDAETSGIVVRDAVEAMSAIERSAQQISQIIGVIDEIAFQTNLLALNAGVEAARAGDAGRGFAVVASEVRALAQRSAEAAKEIKTLISASTSQVDTGVKLVGQTGEALQRIVGRVAEIDGLVSEIAASANEQATGLQQVNTAVNQMDQVTQQNAAMVEQSTAASHSLSQEADVLASSVSRFRTSGAATQPQTARTQARPVAQMRTVGRGGAAPRPHAVEDGWEEF